jgi:HEAT repeat protein
MSRWAQGILLLGLLPAWGEAESPQTRLKRYESLAREGKAGLRIDAIRELRAADDPRIAKALLEKAFRDEDFRVSEAAVKFLARTATPEVVQWIRAQGIPHADPRVRFYSLRFLAVLPEPPSLAVLAAFAADSHWILRLEAAGLLAACRDEGAVGVLRGLLPDPMGMVRGSALLGLGDQQASGLLPEIRKALLDKDWRVRSSALEVVVKMKDLGAEPFLRQALKKETELRMIDDLEQGMDALAIARQEAVAEQEQVRREAQRQAEAVGGVEEAYTRPPVTGIDYGPALKDLKTVAGRIVFVLDCSASMQQVLYEPPAPAAPGAPPEPEKNGYDVGEVGSVAKRKPRSDEEAMGYDRDKQAPKSERFPPTKLGFGQRELCQAIRQLKPESSFNVICYQSAGKQQVWKPALVQASASSIADALHFVKRQAAAGETATYDALVTALGFQEYDLFRPGAVWDPKDWPDTVVLISDGRPTEGVIIQDEEIQASVRRLYRICRTRIHTIGVGREMLPVLENIAAITGGRFIHIADVE